MSTTPTRKPPKQRHPALANTPEGVWNPEAAGKVPGYPHTQEGFDRRVEQLRLNSQAARDAGKLDRRGVPTGWHGCKEQIAVVRRNAQTKAEMLADDLDTLGLLDTDGSFEAEAARFAITEMAAIAFSKVEAVSTRLTAMKMLLHYVRPKPAQRSAVTLAGGLDFLSGLAAEAAAVRQAGPVADAAA